MYRRRKTTVVLLAILLVLLVIVLVSRSCGSAEVSAAKIKYKDYSYQDVSLKVMLPKTTNVTEDYYSSGEMLLNSYLSDEKLKYHGYIQIWNVSDPKKFIEKSKLKSTFHFKSFEHEQVDYDTYSGYLVTWSAQLEDSGDIAGVDYILQGKGKGDQILRVSLAANETVFSDELVKMAETIIGSLEGS